MKTWNNTDKSDWSDGPWMTEPDKAHWVAHDLDCLIVRGPMGALCGYVGVPANHPCFGVDYSDEKLLSIEVHGGLTFADKCDPSEDESAHICHPKQGAANEVVWWLGFDCAHCYDLAPKTERLYREQGLQCGSDVYRDMGYVQSQTENLANQLRALS